jgi:DNA gyrase subunit A
VRIAGRNTQGVRIFRTDTTEKVVSVERISDVGGEENGEAGDVEATPTGGGEGNGT